MENGPIFIAGTDRAGKTLMSAVVSSHPRIAVPAVGSNLWTLFYGRFGPLDSEARFERCLAALLAYSHVRFLEPDADRLRIEFRQGERSYARLFGLLLEHYAQRQGKPRWGDQTGLIEGYADAVLGAYPDGRMIHMLRDPRDRYDASLAIYPEGRLRAGGAVARWLYSARLARRNAERFNGRYLVVHYEEFVANPEAVVRRICDLLGETFDPAMLTLRGMPGYRQRLIEEAGNPPDGAPLISDRYVGVHRGRVPARELAFLEWRAGREMQRAGYQLSEPRLSAGDRLRLALVDVPLNEGRLRFWQARTAVSRWMPRFAGRKPGARYLVPHAG
ncbi:MAG TPA: sulfotransferase [Candidatus Limnocylindria bacterium]